MFAVGMAGVLVGDATMFTIGRVYGKSVLKLPFYRQSADAGTLCRRAGKI